MLSRGSLRARRHLYASFGVALTAYIPGTVAAAIGATAGLSAARRERLREVSGALEHACVRARAAACAAVLAPRDAAAAAVSLLGLALGSPTTDPRSFAAPSQASALSQRRRRERGSGRPRTRDAVSRPAAAAERSGRLTRAPAVGGFM